MSTPNMSYCRYRNTLLAVNQILYDFEDGIEEDLSEEEERAKKQLINACEEFLEQTGRLEEI